MNSKFKGQPADWRLDSTPVVLTANTQLSEPTVLRYRAQLDVLAQDFGADLSKPISDTLSRAESWNRMALGYFSWYLDCFFAKKATVSPRWYEEVLSKSVNFFKNSRRRVDEKIVALWDELAKEGDLV
jgi:hypothetical protein